MTDFAREASNGVSRGQQYSKPDSLAGLLVVEDDAELAQQTCLTLQESGYRAIHAGTLAAASVQLEIHAVDLIILDRMLPDGDGLVYLRGIRESGFDKPSLILSALGETSERVRGLNEGADDYLAKPVDFGELKARVAALLRRALPSGGEFERRVGDLHLDLLARTATRDGVSINLQPREFALLAYLAEHEGDIVTKDMLLKHVWNLNFDPQTNVVEVHMSRLRAKLDRGNERKLLHTVRGNGYCLRA